MNAQGSKKNPNGGIEWTHILGPRTGFTANPVSGCQHACRWKMPDGKLAICYAEAVAERFPGTRYRDGFGKIKFWPEELEKIREHNTPAGIFIDSMADLFGKNVPDEWIFEVVKTIRDCPQHVFFSLTKNPRRLMRLGIFDRWWPNWLVGISVPPSIMFGKELSLEQQKAWLRRGLEFLRDCPSQRRWISIEPLSFDVSLIIGETDCPLDWAVIGAASNGVQTFQPTEKNLQNCLAVLDLMRVPVFMKGNLDRKFVEICGGVWREEWPALDDRINRMDRIEDGKSAGKEILHNPVNPV